jgi:hypothetical protein
MSSLKSKLVFIKKKTFAVALTPELLDLNEEPGYSLTIENHSASYQAYISDSSANLTAGIYHIIQPFEKMILASDFSGGSNAYEFFLNDLWVMAENDSVILVVSKLARRGRV